MRPLHRIGHGASGCGFEPPELTDKLRWFEQSTDPFVRSLVRVAYGVRGQGAANISVRMVRLCMTSNFVWLSRLQWRRYTINYIKTMT